MSARVRAVFAAGSLCLALLALIATDADQRRVARRENAPAHDALVEATGLADLALSSSARWLRHPSLAEPAAAISDLPAGLDVDPAGALIGPPREILRVGAIEVVVRR